MMIPNVFLIVSTTWVTQGKSSSDALAVRHSRPESFIVFAVFATGSQILYGQLALAALSNKLCNVLCAGIFAIPALIISFPRTLDGLSWLSVLAVIAILVVGIVGMIGASPNSTPDATYSPFRSSSFVNAFVSVMNLVFAYAESFM
ncbi:hypothetical protein BJ878DRAFT_482225 [Calycina marina]|uniref:Amino acid transporter transmembrane domain-containing protein n=1 Tax=Calycina marina TaxID=1763456 RepID=A0A9P7YYX5_9HELO|nr:hypothetical protein BJ878DRAFT_482225 [Calycina marina]